MKIFCVITCLMLFVLSQQVVSAQQPLAQQAFAIFEQHCLDCHGEFGSYGDVLTIKHKDLIEDRSVIPRQPDASEFYLRLIGDTDNGSRMPLGQDPLDSEAIAIIRRWIEVGAPDWEAIPKPKRSFITTEVMLKTIHTHVTSLTAFDRSFARYFTLTHLYNAGATDDNLRAYRNALSKLVNSLSWGAEVIKPIPIDREETIFYIELRHYEWDIKSDKWYKIEQAYPYGVQLKSPMYTTLCQETDCELPFIRADWFIAAASLPPLYHEILDLPNTDTELETQLEVNVAENLKNAPGVRVWRAGFNESGVSVNNRVVERHKSRYGAYWKSYDFAGNVGTQNIFTHPLDFTHDGGEIIFNLPNGLQGYYLSTANIRHQVEKGESLYEISKEYGVPLKSIVQVNNIRPTVRLKVGESLLILGIGGRLDAAPINIVSNTGTRDPVVRNGLSCMGCHTEGIKTFEDQMRPVIAQNRNPSYDKAQALRLYAEKSEMDSFVREDIARYRRAIEAAGGVFGGSEPIQQLVKQFEGPLDAAYAASEVGLETDDFLQEIRENSTLQNAGLLVLGVEKGNIKRDAWESQFGTVVSVLQSRVDKPERIVVDKDSWPGQTIKKDWREKPELTVPDEVPDFEVPDLKVPEVPNILIESRIVPPRYKSKVEPKYPEVAAKAGKEGEVILQATIAENGIPRDIVAITNIGFELEEAAIVALQQTMFHPATKGGNPISLQVEIPYSFTLKTRSNSVYADMVLIPVGEFRMGSNEGDEDEKPVHTVYLDAFYIDKYEVTNAEYKAFVDTKPEWGKNRIPNAYHDGNYLKHWNGNNYPSGKGNHPVTNVSWYAAMAYAQWAGKRLPTEAEWEKAARGKLANQKYPWGNSIDSRKANYDSSVRDTTPVGSYPPNNYGLYDMAGNISEWCLDAYHWDFYVRSPRLNPISDDTILNIISNFTKIKISRVLRSGSLNNNSRYVRVSARLGYTPSYAFNAGFRCVRAVAR